MPEKVLLFRLGAELYGLPVTSVQEVVEPERVFPIPAAPDIFTGAINCHGTVVPVVDLPRLLGFEGDERDARMVVADAALARVELAVSRLEQIVEPDDTQGVDGRDAIEAECVAEVLDHQGRMIHLLDLAAVFDRLERLI